MRAYGFVVLSLALLLVAGCGDGNPPAPVGVVVTGKVVKGGVSLAADRLPPGEVAAEIVFVPEVGTNVEREPLGPDGSFKEAGWGKGIQPGAYRIAVYHYVQGRGSDGLSGAFSETASPIRVEIPESKKAGTHDLGTIELNDYAK